ncbi:sirohydrochlorin chelatase [Bacillus xiapuensis]|uniref:sirohydrochlorin chelatase n=1 Tax=Bacillus xiapuensis TaxID=2014075 RepID=UPI000C24A24A|nr:sirohydrochlorin chelatase [Bacillus xiapuensis]
MKAVLYICHGSRVKKGCQEALDFIERCKPLTDVKIQEACFLELAEPTIEQGFSRCVERGATEIIVFPFLLLEAGHAKKDIPAALSKVSAKFPKVRTVYKKPVGVHEKMIDILIERMTEKGVPVSREASVLIVGRGSSDPQTAADFQRIRQLFRSKTKLNDVNICFLAAATPAFSAELQRLSEKETKQIWVLPYLLFTGILMKKMEKDIQELSASTPVFLCSYLGYHPHLCHVIAERIAEEVTQK